MSSCSPRLALPAPTPAVEVLHAIPAGTIVTLPDGTVGDVSWSSYAEVHVVHSDRTLGRGPWIMHRYQCEPSSAVDAAAYAARCRALTSGGRL